MLKVRFGSEQAGALRDELMKFFAQTTYCASIDLAVEKGMFPLCNPTEHAASPFVLNLDLPEEYMQKLKTTGIRNSSLMSMQPTGNTSIFANLASGGIEPVFSPEYIRTSIVPTIPDHIRDRTPKFFEGECRETELFKFTKEGDEEILRGVDEFGTVFKIDKSRGLTKETVCMDYGVRWLAERGEWDPTADWAASAMNLNASDHVNDLKGFARWVDSAISKTVNVPNDYPYAGFQQLYIDAYETGFIKGITTYRSGTMTAVLSTKDEKNAGQDDEEIILEDVKMPDSYENCTVKILRAEGKKWYLTVGWNEDKTRPLFLFVQTNHHDKSVATSSAVDALLELAREKGIPEQHITSVEEKIESDNNASKIARVVSLCLRHGILIRNIVAVLDTVEVFAGSFLFQVRKFLSSFIKDGEKVEGAKCENCGSSNIVYSEGCQRCSDCASSKCG